VLTLLLQYGRVHPFDPATDKYKVVYRDGISTWKTEPEIKQAQDFTEDITMGRNTKWSFDDARSAQDEPILPVLVTVLQTQGEDIPVLSEEQTIERSKTPSVPEKVAVSGATLPIVPTQQSKDENPSTTCNGSDDRALKTPKARGKTTKSKWVMKHTFVATEAGPNPRFPRLLGNATGWCLGTLTQYDSTKTLPYLVAWDTVPKCSYVVSEAEMETLVNNYTLCGAKDPQVSASTNKPEMNKNPGPKNSKLRKSKWPIAKTFLVKSSTSHTTEKKSI
jgi:hypothetical protein